MLEVTLPCCEDQAADRMFRHGCILLNNIVKTQPCPTSSTPLHFVLISAYCGPFDEPYHNTKQRHDARLPIAFIPP